MNIESKLTIIPSDGFVALDGEAAYLPKDFLIELFGDINAIHWDNGKGSIEYMNDSGKFKAEAINWDDYAVKFFKLEQKFYAKLAKDSEELYTNSYGAYDKIHTIRSIRDSELFATDFLMMPDYPADEDTKKKAVEYRKWLRDMTKLPGYPWDGGGKETPWPDCYPWDKTIGKFYKEAVEAE